MIDITDSSPSRVNAGIEHLLEGGAIRFYGVNFKFASAPSESTLSVSTFSEYQPDRVTEEMARQAIEQSKEIGEALATECPQFRKIWTTQPKVFNFCWDYGMGAIIIATERENYFKWLLNKA